MVTITSSSTGGEFLALAIGGRGRAPYFAEILAERAECCAILNR